MRLQRLEISGFKSFSDPAQLSFDQRVTAIVGPNGCGKSNVAEAITWVLGEQSAKSLRGDRMEDVIFNGSDARKPTGSAEVKLRLADVETMPARALQGGGNGHSEGNASEGNGNGHSPADHGEDVLAGDLTGRVVEVTRRLYRSGESEYLIDGEVCRLRDIHELLMDTGLGAKAYAIIEQGKIGMILSSRATDRRQLIEEAAGVTKYRARRRAAELKLDASKQNLTRIDDIVSEVEKQRAALKRQAAKARRYRRLREDLRTWEKRVFARRYRELTETLESARGRFDQVRASEVAASTRVASLEADLAAARIALAEAESAATATRERAHAIELDVSRQEQQIEFDQQRLSGLAARADELGLELTDLQARREPGRLAVEDARLAAESAEQSRDAAAAELRTAEERSAAARQAIEGLEADVEAARSEVFSAINAASTLRHAIEHAASSEERVHETLAKLDSETAALQAEIDRFASSRTTGDEALKKSQVRMAETRLTRAARESQLASMRLDLDHKVRALRSHEQESAALGARLKSLEEIEIARAQYTEAARVVLAEADALISPLGSVADSLETDRRYERAVESCLGEVLQAVLVRTRDHALAGLAALQSRNIGRCGFLIVDDIDGAAANRSPRPAEPPPGIQTLASVVRIEGPHRHAIASVVGEAWIAESFEIAAEAARHTTVPVATLDGHVFRGPRLISGGGKEEVRGILGTRREIKELKDQIARETSLVARLTNEWDALERAIAEGVAATESLTVEVHAQEKSIVGFELQVQRASEELERLNRKRELLITERRGAEEEQRGLAGRQLEARQAIARLESEQREADERLALAQGRLWQARETIDGLARAEAEAMAAHRGLVERAAALAAEVVRLEETTAELDSRVERSVNERRQNADRRLEVERAIQDGQSQMDRAVLDLESIRGDARVLEDAVSTHRLRAAEQESSIREARRTLEDLRASLSDVEIARATVESDLAHLASTCLEAVHATLDQVAAEVDELPAVEELSAQSLAPGLEADETGDEEGEPQEAGEARPPVAPPMRSADDMIAHLRDRIDRLGPVNMMAIEQFDELEARHSFLTTQRKDLVDSIASTAEAIRRIDETTKQRFREAFDAINGNFQQTFSTLFGGGRAGLTLLDENDLLESGIEIIAQPPGKRLQSVQLLSGGEKALTAIALMFALFRHKPSPFCLLDEIDAPLDDANIGRFVEMLRAMQAETQFILITHNRKTMEIADRLYGVTMEEPGVSKLISVALH